MNEWAEFYERLFNFRQIRYFDIEGKLTGLHSRAMTSPDGKIRIPINEDAGEKGQIEEYLQEYKGEGIQHVAMGSLDLYRSIEQLLANGLEFMPAPNDIYYSRIDQRLPKHGEPLDRLQRNGILIDGEGVVEGGYTKVLLQRFSKTAHRPDLLRVHPAQRRRRLRRRQLQGALRVDRGGPDPPRRAERECGGIAEAGRNCA